MNYTKWREWFALLGDTEGFATGKTLKTALLTEFAQYISGLKGELPRVRDIYLLIA